MTSTPRVFTKVPARMLRLCNSDTHELYVVRHDSKRLLSASQLFRVRGSEG
jgi:hypothetical protein